MAKSAEDEALSLSELISAFLLQCVDLVEARAHEKLERARVETLASLAEAAQTRLAAGAGTTIDVFAANQSLSAAKVEAEDASAGMARLERMVAASMGSAPPAGLSFDDFSFTPPAFDAGLRSRHARAAIRAAEAEASASSIVPNLSLSISSATAPLASPVTFSASLGATLGISLSPFDRRSAASQARLESEKASIASRLASDARVAAEAVEATARALSRLELHRAASRDSLSYLKAVEDSFAAGASSSRDVLEARSVTHDRDLAELRAAAGVARARIEAMRCVGFPDATTGRGGS